MERTSIVNFENMKVLQNVFIQDFDIDRIFSSYIINVYPYCLNEEEP